MLCVESCVVFVCIVLFGFVSARVCPFSSVLVCTRLRSFFHSLTLFVCCGCFYKLYVLFVVCVVCCCLYVRLFVVKWFCLFSCCICYVVCVCVV